MRLILLLWLSLAAPAFAQTSQQEQRARDIGAQLRCVVCQNQSIEESDAQLAQDMRRLVREQLATGASDELVIEYIRESYGDYVLLKPPVQSNTYVLWFFPALFVFFCLAWFVFRPKQIRPPAAIDPLTVTDEAILKKLMGDNT